MQLSLREKNYNGEVEADTCAFSVQYRWIRIFFIVTSKKNPDEKLGYFLFYVESFISIEDCEHIQKEKWAQPKKFVIFI